MLAFARLQHFHCELSHKLLPYDKWKANLHTEGYSSSWNALSEVCCSISKRPNFGEVTPIFEYLYSKTFMGGWFYHKTRHWLSEVSDLGHPKQSLTFQNVCFHSTKCLKAQSEYFRLKRSLILNFLLKINAQKPLYKCRRNDFSFL